MIDLKFFKGGVKKWVTDHLSWNYKCTKCGALFIPEGVPDGRAAKYGQGLEPGVYTTTWFAGRICLGSDEH